jgi:3-phenylpropionate/trans-cinnamate dioxygenase ferredoxin reductase component
MVLGPTDHVAVVGAGLAGWRVCEELRRHDFAGRVTLIGDEAHAPYDRPPLSKQVMSGKWPLDHTTLATPERLASSRVDLRLGVGAAHLAVATTTVTLRDGDDVRASRVVIATGSRARRPAWYHGGLYEVRTRDDAARLVARLDELSHGDVVAIIGGGFIGAEVATAVTTRGLTALVLEAASRPLLGVLGEEVSRWLVSVPGDFGVEVRTGQRIVAVEPQGDDGDAEVVMEDGSRVAARAVVVGVGAQPNVEWLADSGLEIDNGVVVDARQLCGEDVAAVGDVANFPWSDGTRGRIEHWQVATDHAGALARYWTTGEESGEVIPYFWSDQYAKKIQMLGHPRPDDDVERVVDTPPGHWLGLYSRAGLVTGLVALSQPRALMLSRVLLERPTSRDEALTAAPWAAPARGG